MEGNNSSVSSFGLLLVSALELALCEQELTPQGDVWSDGSTTVPQTPAAVHLCQLCNTCHRVPSATAQTPVYVGVRDALVPTHWFQSLR